MVENELQFVGWEKFRQMVPSIIQLEVSRLERVLGTVGDETALHNAIVKARFELKEFAASLRQASKDELEEQCAPHLESALLTVSMAPGNGDDEVTETLRYVADRLEHVHDRMEMIY